MKSLVGYYFWEFGNEGLTDVFWWDTIFGELRKKGLSDEKVGWILIGVIRNSRPGLSVT